MKLAPIVLFVYNRPWHTKQTIEALQKNELATESELIIFSDGPKNVEQKDNVRNVREFLSTIGGFKKVDIIESRINRGLADSIITGVTEICNNHNKVIVLEDDNVSSPSFLSYMNNALNFYENDSRVMHITSFMCPHNKTLPETFFYKVPHCSGGWATWQRAWVHFNSDTKFLFDYFDKRNLWKQFNKFGGNYLEYQIRANLSGELKTWFIKWHASVMIQNGYTLYPSNSLVQNIGFDNTGEHCGVTNKFNISILKESVTIRPIKFRESKKAGKIFKEFYNTQSNKNNLFRRILRKISRLV